VQWVVALGLDGNALGAVRFAVWMARAEDRLHGIHVLRRTEYFGLAERALDELAASTQTTEAFEDLHVVDHRDVTGALVDSCDAHGADFMVVGRRARRNEATPVRLGRVTRRLLRTLPGPIVVVPPDFEPERAGSGPVVVATDLSDDCVPACRRAATLAKRLERSLVLAHVVPDPRDWGIGILTAAQVDAFADELRTMAATRARAWCERHDLGSAHVELRMGEVVEQLTRLTQEVAAPLVVLGSRRLGLLARLFTSSLGSALAASLPSPVVVVPPVGR
jgi:nucleotide-binding universal stress UspA family protein